MEPANQVIKWQDSDAKKILLSDLETGTLPPFASDFGPKEAWEAVYSSMPEFSGMEYSLFRSRLNTLRIAFRRRRTEAEKDEAALQHDRKLHPRKPTNEHGEVLYDLSPSKPLLCMDVAAGLHEQMSLAQLHNSRLEYLDFERDRFKNHLYQEKRRKKFVTYLHLKREKGETELSHILGGIQAVRIGNDGQEERKKAISSMVKDKKLTGKKKKKKNEPSLHKEKESERKKRPANK